ncbi:hypothetical protein GCM10023224_34740 [Streptomonospora halophila]|uniref:Uncharacterized protein n=1 Tax=Streptomonospora halophila TaxID=427369 RepID=A0ABP9GMA5_9ACTN
MISRRRAVGKRTAIVVSGERGPGCGFCGGGAAAYGRRSGAGSVAPPALTTTGARAGAGAVVPAGQGRSAGEERGHGRRGSGPR